MKSLLLSLLLLPLFTFAQNDKDENPLHKLGPNPILIVDSVRVTSEDLQKFSPNTIASLEVLTDTDATKKFGDTATDGAVIILTKSMARRIYSAYFKKKSAAYDSLYAAAKSDSSFVYIVNDKIKTDKFEGDLTAINDDVFISLDILNADDLKNKYNIADKQIGVLIKCRKPKNVFNADQKY
jgi:hypothetical protein